MITAQGQYYYLSICFDAFSDKIGCGSCYLFRNIWNCGCNHACMFENQLNFKYMFPIIYQFSWEISAAAAAEIVSKIIALLEDIVLE